MSAFAIRPARPGDAPALWSILEPVIRAGETYALDPDMGEAEALAYWTGPDRECFVAEADGRAMQFNFVVSTNERAMGLWRSMGFDVVGRLPGAFRHPVHGDVDALVMFRAL